MKNWLLTTNGIYDFDLREIGTPFSNRLVHHGSYGQEQLAVIVDRSEIWTLDGEWTRQVVSDLELKCLLWTGNGLLVGTEQGKLAWVDLRNSTDLVFIEEFEAIENRSEWTTPWGGPAKVRSLALDADQTIYANVHVGWIVRSVDSGVSWNPSTSMEKDVHHVSTKASEQGMVAVATANGVYISQDSGMSFDRRWDISQTYCRTVEWYPDQDVMLASVSNGSSGTKTRLVRSTDQGETWHRAEGLPDTINTNINTYQLNLIPGGAGYVIIENNRLFKTEDYGSTWQNMSIQLPKTYQVISVPDE